MGTLESFIKSVINSCPYTMAGKKCIEVVKGKKKVNKISDDKILNFKSGIKTGRNISLIGVFCPFFWYSLLSGMSTKFILMNAMHSSIVILLGFIVILLNYLALLHYRRKIEKCNAEP